jgi:hypothetical protein
LDNKVIVIHNMMEYCILKKRKMRPLKYILIILILTSCYNPNNGKKSELKNIDILFQTGCYTRIDYSISIMTENGHLIAKKTRPNYYYGTKTDSIWKVKIDKKQLEIINAFIQRAKELNGVCPIRSTSVDDYKIIIHNDTTYSIHGNCDWGGLDYFSLERLLFNEHFNDLEKKRNVLKDSVNKVLVGQWIVDGLHKELKQSDSITLSRTNYFKKDMIVWSFGDSLKFRSLENKIFDLKLSNSYNLIVNDGSVDLEISSGASTDKNGNMTIENYGAYFSIMEMNADKIILKYWKR